MNNQQGSWRCGGCGIWYAYWVSKCECEAYIDLMKSGSTVQGSSDVVTGTGFRHDIADPPYTDFKSLRGIANKKSESEDE